jgi:hypothetical protein
MLIMLKTEQGWRYAFDSQRGLQSHAVSLLLSLDLGAEAVGELTISHGAGSRDVAHSATPAAKYLLPCCGEPIPGFNEGDDDV